MLRPTRYISTRGDVAPQGFCDILLGGLAPDGGLYLPEDYPQVADRLSKWRDLSYAELAFEILSLYIDDIPPADLKAICNKTYTAQIYRFSRDPAKAKDIVPLTTLEPNFHLLELSNGPTLAFKDMAMQLLGNLFEYVLARRDETINILGATSGDTGSSAEYAMLGKRGVRVFMLSPQKRMTPFQAAQMYSLVDPSIFNIAITGVFDDAQDVVKAVSNDAAFKAKYKIGAVNSINWARVVAQIVYYFKGYFAATKSNDEQVSFAVPTGNFGDICAGHIARMMGLPINLVLATNENDVLDEFFRTGVYRPRTSDETRVTSSPSMDISKASNFERFISDFAHDDSVMVRELWAQIDTQGHFDLSKTYQWKDIADFGIVSGSSTHADRVATIHDVWERYGIMIDPHTADAMKVAREHREAGIPMVVLETAQASKFVATIREALGRYPVRPTELIGLEERGQLVTLMAPDAEQIKRFIADRV